MCHESIHLSQIKVAAEIKFNGAKSNTVHQTTHNTNTKMNLIKAYLFKNADL